MQPYVARVPEPPTKRLRDNDRHYLSVKLDDPSLSAPNASLMKAEDEESFILIWSRRSGDWSCRISRSACSEAGLFDWHLGSYGSNHSKMLLRFTAPSRKRGQTGVKTLV